MERESLWNQTEKLQGRAALAEDISVDVAVIGGGLTGILTSHFLEQSGRECVVLEADTIGGGQTGNTTAKITSQHNLIYQKLMQSVGKEKAKLYAAANQKAIEQYRILIEKYGIDCEWRDCPAYLYTTGNGELLRKEHRAAVELGLPAELTEQTELPFDVKQALCFQGQACFHPLKFLNRIAEDVKVYEHTKVLRVEGHLIETDRGNVTASKIVFACHYPFVLSPGYYFLRMHQERSYVLALRGTPQMQGMYLGIDQDGLSFRSAGDMLLLGGAGHRAGENVMGNQYQYLLQKAEEFWPECRKILEWSAQDCMTLDGIPYIGKFGRKTDDWFVATGYQKWGMTSSMSAALILTDLICGRENPYAEVFSPQRMTVGASAKTFLQEGKYASVNLLKEKFVPPKETLEQIRPGQGGVVELDGEKTGVYKDEKGNVYAVSVKCPHLGCQLVWNPDEKSWDCPCHGSRFDYRGNLLDGPAQEAVCRVRKSESQYNGRVN